MLVKRDSVVVFVARDSGVVSLKRDSVVVFVARDSGVVSVKQDSGVVFVKPAENLDQIKIKRPKSLRFLFSWTHYDLFVCP